MTRFGAVFLCCASRQITGRGKLFSSLRASSSRGNCSNSTTKFHVCSFSISDTSIPCSKRSKKEELEGTINSSVQFGPKKDSCTLTRNIHIPRKLWLVKLIMMHMTGRRVSETGQAKGRTINFILKFMDKVENHEPNKMQCHLVYESHGSYNYGVKFHGASKNFIVGAFKSRNPLLR
ncbi:uncharacterized protein LOC111019226 [Momordica charantia]|uniref:Uncharacterized protein LOC111019226 n=1 Tax=Momordica charantia TaxID=3673 RepID=A0A6J1DBQ2_MOMCH|nr:uncharacterized protein LOC111019226 [Momordica charantia]